MEFKSGTSDNGNVQTKYFRDGTKTLVKNVSLIYLLHVYELDPVKGSEFRDKLNDCKLFKKESEVSSCTLFNIGLFTQCVFESVLNNVCS